MIKRKSLNGIDICKFLMVICVVAIHTHPLEKCSNPVINVLYSQFVQLAVPFFFLSSGYLLALKLQWPYQRDADIAIIKKKIRKMLQMYLLWSLVYLPLAIYDYIQSGVSLKWALLMYVRGFFLVGEHYNSWPLWYLLSSIYALIYIGVCCWKKVNFQIILFLSSLISLISFLLNSLMTYEGKFPELLQLMREIVSMSIVNGRILSGMIYIPIGMYLAHKRLSNKINISLMIVGYVTNCLIDNSILSSYLLVFTAIGLFGMAEAVKIRDSQIYLYILVR